MDLIALAPLIGASALGTGIIFRVVGRSWERKQLQNPGGQHQLTIMNRNTLRDKLVSLQVQNPDLPAVPPDATFYEVWFTEALERIKKRAVSRTIQEETKLRRQINDLQLENLRFLKTQKEINQTAREIQHDEEHASRRATRAEDLEEHRYKAERAKLELEIAEAQEKLRRLGEKPTPKPARLPKLERIANMKKQQARDHERFAADPDMQGMSDRDWDDKLRREMEGSE